MGAAYVLRGQQYWKVPASCSRRALEAPAGLLGEEQLQPEEEVEEGAELRSQQQQQQQHRTVAEECAAVCPHSSSDTVTSAEVAPAEETQFVLPVRLHSVYGVDVTPSACDAQAHTRKRLQVSEVEVDFSADGGTSQLVLRQDAAVASPAGHSVKCFVVNGASQVSSSKDGSGKLPLPSTCRAVAVLEEPCRPYLPNCTSPAQAAAAVPVSVPPVPTPSTTIPGVEDVVVALHMRVQGLHYENLATFQESDLISAFSSIFKVRYGYKSVVIRR